MSRIKVLIRLGLVVTTQVVGSKCIPSALLLQGVAALECIQNPSNTSLPTYTRTHLLGKIVPSATEVIRSRGSEETRVPVCSRGRGAVSPPHSTHCWKLAGLSGQLCPGESGMPLTCSSLLFSGLDESPAKGGERSSTGMAPPEQQNLTYPGQWASQLLELPVSDYTGGGGWVCMSSSEPVYDASLFTLSAQVRL